MALILCESSLSRLDRRAQRDDMAGLWMECITMLQLYHVAYSYYYHVHVIIYTVVLSFIAL